MHIIWIVILLLALPATAPAQTEHIFDDAADDFDHAADMMDDTDGFIDDVPEQVETPEVTADDAVETVPAGPGLTELLRRQLGVTQGQATGGAGAIFALAKEQMSENDFAKVSVGMPNMSSLLAAAPAVGLGEPGSRAAAGLDAFAAQAGAVGTATRLAGAFSNLDMGPGMVAQFIPICVQYVQQASGPQAAALLQAALP